MAATLAVECALQHRLSCLAPPPCSRGLLLRASAQKLESSSTADDGSSSSSSSSTPEWAKPGSTVPPPWASNEQKQPTTPSEGPRDLPFYVYLLASSLVAIAAVGSVFEYANKNPVFGVVQADSPLYTPLLGFFSITGVPVSAFLWFRAIKLANKASEEQDREDGYL